MLERVYTVDEIKNIIEPIARRYGVERVYLFGSYARGEATPKSDVDLRIDAGEIRGLFQLGGLYADIEDSLGKPLDLVTSDSMNKDFYNRIKKEECIIYG